MQRQRVASRALREVGYDPPTHTLEVTFASGTVYRYFDVPEFLSRGLTVAKSKGTYFAKRINGRFRFEQVK